MFSDNITERHNYFLNQIRNNNYELNWVPLYLENIVVMVSSDALKIDGIRINVSAKLNQEIADILDASLLTPKLFDLIWINAKAKVPPQVQVINSTSAGMVKNNNSIDKWISNNKIIVDPKSDIVCSSKIWCLDDLINSQKAMNYGFMCNKKELTDGKYKGISVYPSVSEKDAFVIQPPSTWHDPFHLDYSQICYLVNNSVFVDGQLTRLIDVFRDKELSKLICHKPLSKFRQP